MDEQHLSDISLHGSFEGEICLWHSSYDGGDILDFTFACVFIVGKYSYLLGMENDFWSGRRVPGSS